MNITEDLKTKMCNSSISKVIDFEKLEKESKRSLRIACKARENAQKLKNFEDFFESDGWQRTHGSKGSYDIAFDVVNKTFGNGNGFIYNNGKVTHGKEFWYKLSPEHQKFIIDVDNAKKIGVYKNGDICIKYIGSIAGGEIHTSHPQWWGEGWYTSYSN